MLEKIWIFVPAKYFMIFKYVLILDKVVILSLLVSYNTNHVTWYCLANKLGAHPWYQILSCHIFKSDTHNYDDARKLVSPLPPPSATGIINTLFTHLVLPTKMVGKSVSLARFTNLFL